MTCEADPLSSLINANTKCSDPAFGQRPRLANCREYLITLTALLVQRFIGKKVIFDMLFCNKKLYLFDIYYNPYILFV